MWFIAIFMIKMQEKCIVVMVVDCHVVAGGYVQIIAC
jgi:hypothetical protein